MWKPRNNIDFVESTSQLRACVLVFTLSFYNFCIRNSNETYFDALKSHCELEALIKIIKCKIVLSDLLVTV